MFNLASGKLLDIAMAMAVKPKILLLDEPLEGVAPVLAHRLADVIAGLKSQGLSVILSESDLSHSQEILDTVYTIDRGEVSIATA